MAEESPYGAIVRGPPGLASWVVLDASGQVQSAGGAGAESWADSWVGTAWASRLTRSSRSHWDETAWPDLKAIGQCHELSLELKDARGAILSYWWREGEHFHGWFLPDRDHQRRLRALEWAQSSLAGLPGAVLQLRVEGPAGLKVEWASEGLQPLLGVSPAGVCARSSTLLDALTPDSGAGLVRQMLEWQSSGEAEGRVLLVPVRWPERVVQWQARRGLHASEAWDVVLTDVSERETLQRALHRQARTDALTQLGNRAAFVEFLQAETERGRTLTILFAGCDRFKQVNDTRGHAVGDELLRHLGQRLRHRFRGPGGVDPNGVPMVARFGGDEFGLALAGVSDGATALDMAQRLGELAARPFRLDLHTVSLTMSVGVTIVRPGDPVDEAIRNADTALHEAKRRGRGSAVLFEPAMRDRLVESQAMEADLRDALRRQALRAVFQPIVEIGSGRIVGLEALARWRHATRGEVPPAQFVALAEECGLASELGLCMLREVCAHLGRWRAEGVALPERVSVNLSRAQLREEHLVDQITAVVAQAGVPCSQLQFEVTESLAMDDARAVAVLHQLRERGFRLALDDFGTGHSSLATLPRFPIQQLKIDRSFVREMVTSSYHRALVQAALQVAHALGLEVVAEGVETAEQAKALAGLGCTRAQGWLYARALEPVDVPDCLARGLAAIGAEAREATVVAHASRAHQVIVTNATGITQYVNQAFTLNTGYTLGDMVGRTPGSVLQGPASDPAAVQVLRDAVQSCTGCMGVEIVNYRKDGTPFAVRLDIEPVRDAAGQVVEFVSVQTEVSELRQVRSDLAEIRRREDEIRSLGIVGFWERDLRTGTARWDTNTRRMLGLAPGEEALGWDEVLAQCTPETRSALQAYVDSLKSGQTAGFLEYTLVLRDGREVDLLSRWRREGARVLGVTVDLSGSARRRNAVRLQLHQIALATEAAQQLCWVADVVSGHIQWFGSPSLRGLDALRRCSHWDEVIQLVAPEDRGRVLQARFAGLQSIDPVEVDFRVSLPDGEQLMLHSRRRSVRDAAGQPTHVVGVVMDVSRLRQNEADLRAMTLRHDVVLDAAGLGVFRFDFSEARFEFDERFASIYGLPETQRSMSWREWLALVDERDRPLVLDQARRAMNGLELEDRRFRIRRADGELRWVASHRRIERRTDGSVVALVGAHRDVTESEESRELQQELAAERSARHERSRLLAAVAHELGNPLQGVLGLTHLLVTGSAPGEDPALSARLTALQKAAQAMNALLQDLQDLARASHGREVLREPVDLHSRLRALVTEFTVRAQTRGIVLGLACEPGAEALADGQRVEQILRNLLANAIKYHKPEGGRVDVACERRACSWSIRVSDDGPGIRAEHVPQLFTEFYRAGRIDETGTGMGLAISRAWAHAMGGTLEVQCPPSGGSVFELSLPAA